MYGHLAQHRSRCPLHPLHLWLRGLRKGKTVGRRGEGCSAPSTLPSLPSRACPFRASAAQVNGPRKGTLFPTRSHFHRHSWLCFAPSRCGFGQSDLGGSTERAGQW